MTDDADHSEARYRDADFLRHRYVDQRQSASEIAASCSVTASTVARWLGRHGITDGEPYERTTCAACDDYFRYAPTLRDGTYCSNACANEQRKRQVTIECPGCGTTFERRESLDTEYCSMACWSDNNDSCSDWYELYGSEWQRQRDRAIQRDEHECIVCGISDSEHADRFGRGLEVYHIVPVRLFDQWDLPVEDAHELSNLVTVCRTHHPDALGRTVDTEV